MWRAEKSHFHASVECGTVWRTKMAQFRTHDLTKVLSYVSTQIQAKFHGFKRNVSNWPEFEYSRMKVPSLSRGCEIYPSQTKILEGGTKDEIRTFLSKDVSTQFGPRTVEKCFENPHFIFCSSFQNLRLGRIKLRNFFVRCMDVA